MAQKVTSNKSKQSDVKTWTNIDGQMRVFANAVEYGTGKNKKSFIDYSTTVSTKDEDGNYINKSLKVTFKRDSAPDFSIGDNILIDIKKGFISLDFYVTDDGEVKKYIKVVVLDYDEV